MQRSCLFIFLAAQSGIGVGDSSGQLGCSFHSGFAVLGGDAVSSLSTVTRVPHQEHFKLLEVVDQELVEAAGQHVLCFLGAQVTDVGHHDPATESPAHPIVNASWFPPVLLKFAHIGLTGVR